jgi:hypothetical protein
VAKASCQPTSLVTLSFTKRVFASYFGGESSDLLAFSFQEVSNYNFCTFLREHAGFGCTHAIGTASDHRHLAG